MIVADLNLISYFWIQGEHSEIAEKVYRKDPLWISVPLWKSEFRNVLAGYLRKNMLSLELASDVIQKAENQLRNNEYGVSSVEVLRLIGRSKCSAYDCEYVALAEYFGVRCVTSDKLILNQFPDKAISIIEFAQTET
jgi:predicted nucleic acid-binding protein